MPFYVLEYDPNRLQLEPHLTQYGTAGEAKQRVLLAPASLRRIVVNGAGSLAEVPTRTLVSIHQQVTGAIRTQFNQREELVDKVLRGIQSLDGKPVPRQETGSMAEATKEKAAPKAKKEPKVRTPKPIAYQPRAKTKIKQVRAGTKIALLIDLLAKGATEEQVAKALSATGKPVNPRTWIGYDLNTVVGYGARVDDKGVIRLVYPEGMTAPHAHTVKEAKTPKATAKKAAAPAAAAK